MTLAIQALSRALIILIFSLFVPPLSSDARDLTCAPTPDLKVGELAPSVGVDVNYGVLAYDESGTGRLAVRQVGDDGLFGTADDHTGIINFGAQSPLHAPPTYHILTPSKIAVIKNEGFLLPHKLIFIESGRDGLFGTSDDLHTTAIESMGYNRDSRLSANGVFVIRTGDGTQTSYSLYYCDAYRTSGRGSCSRGNLHHVTPRVAPAGYGHSGLRIRDSIGVLFQDAGPQASANHYVSFDGNAELHVQIPRDSSHIVIDTGGANLLMQPRLLEGNKLYYGDPIILSNQFTQVSVPIELRSNEESLGEVKLSEYASHMGQLTLEPSTPLNGKLRIRGSRFTHTLPNLPFVFTFNSFALSESSGKEVFGAASKWNIFGPGLGIYGFYCE